MSNRGEGWGFDADGEGQFNDLIEQRVEHTLLVNVWPQAAKTNM